MAVQHDAATSDDPGRPTAIARRTNNAVIIAAEGGEGRCLTKSLLANLVISASGGRRRGKKPSLILR